MNEPLQFAHPAWIWIGLAICVALAFGMVRWNRRRDRDLEKLAHARLLRQLTASVSRKRRVLKQGLWLVALMLVFVAVARPQYGFEYREVKRRGIDIVFAVDTSRSMLAEDVVPNRLERAKLAITDFVEKLNGDRVGLIPFAGNAFSLCPLTLDYSAFFQSLDALDTNIIPHQGTDLATAVSEANRLFDNEGNNHRILILITDGEDLQGAVMDSVATAKEKGMTIHTVGVGESEGALIPLTQSDGSQDFVRDQSGEPVKTALDEGTLKQIAEATGGIYAPLGRSGQGLQTIYQEKLRLVPKSELNQRLDRIPLERFEWPLGAAILLLFFEFLMGDRKRRHRPFAPVISVARRKVATVAVVVSLLLSARNAFAEDLPEPDGSKTDREAIPEDFNDPRVGYNAGTNAYRSGDFAQAEQTLNHTLGNADDLSLQQRSYYNLGNTRYRLGQQSQQQDPKATIAKWEEAVKSYEDALALNPEDEDAKYNRDFVQKKLDELKQQQREQQTQSQSSQDQQDQQSSDSQNQDQSNEQQQGAQNSGKQSDSSDQQKSDDKSQSNQESSDSKEDNDQPSKGENQPEQGSGEDQQQPSPEKGEGGENKSDNSNSTDEGAEEDSKAQPQPAEEKADDSQSPANADDSKEEEEADAPPQPEGGKESDDQKAPDSEDQASQAQPAQTQSGQSEGEPVEEPGRPGSFSEERREPGEMSREEATQLLEALENDERSVIPLPDMSTYRRAVPNNTTKGKTW
ncbi:MAG: VWA domain-containing protein [Verrucomicrobiae bacterium]|nr:VWA domain-containing protein [Verrucomicrobiae bacterium]